MKYYTIGAKENGLRLDKAISLFESSFSRTYIAKLIDEGNCLVNEKPCKASYKVRNGDVVSFVIPEVKPLEIEKEDIPLDIVYEDDDILVINKPQGLVVHPSCGHNEHTLVNAILNHCSNLSGINGVARPGIVHRIDKDTSGLICVAKNDVAHRFLAEQLKDHTMSRVYMALVKGEIKENSGTINMPIGRDTDHRQKMAVEAKNGKDAITNFIVKKRFSQHTLIECHLVTGRTHQIRVHLAAINHPVEGDPLYSGKNYETISKSGQLLTAISLKLIHPTTKKEMVFTVELPRYFQDIIDNLK
ncbi:MAG TPA: RluA family pseudouridine synthase [Bacilli bacterium]|nr:RluA family pseudouridine synthase [Bacilli bacterium]